MNKTGKYLYGITDASQDQIAGAISNLKGINNKALKAGTKPSSMRTGFVAPTNKTISQTDTVTVIRADDTPKGVPNKGPKIIGGGARTANKTGRNDPCPCGSGKKYKKCCGQ